MDRGVVASQRGGVEVGMNARVSYSGDISWDAECRQSGGLSVKQSFGWGFGVCQL